MKGTIEVIAPGTVASPGADAITLSRALSHS